MPNVPLQRWVSGASLIATAAVIGSGGAAPAENRVDCAEIVVYFDEADVALEALTSKLRAECGLDSVRHSFSRELYDGEGGKLSALVFEVPTERRNVVRSAWRTWTSAIEGSGGVVAVEKHEQWRPRGAPLDGSLWGHKLTASDVAAQPAMSQAGAAGAASYGSGSGVTVAVLDGGLDLDHEYLDGVFVGGYDAIDDDNDPQDLGNGVDDDNDGTIDEFVGHGTGVAGLIHAIAPDAKILPIRVLDSDGMGTNLALWLGISKAVSQGADVINLSLVAPSMPDELKDAIDAAVDDGITIVTAAGNDPLASLDHPYLADRATVVGGVDVNDVLLPWSPTGGTVDLYAPAEGLVAPIGGAGAMADSYGWWDGTSFATAFVTGAAAILKETEPMLSYTDVMDRLATSVDPAAGATPSTAGRIDMVDVLD